MRGSRRGRGVPVAGGLRPRHRDASGMAPRGTADVERVARPLVGTGPTPRGQDLRRRTWPGGGCRDCGRGTTCAHKSLGRRHTPTTSLHRPRVGAAESLRGPNSPQDVPGASKPLGGVSLLAPVSQLGEKSRSLGILGDLRGRNGSRWALWAAGRSAVQAPRGRGVVSASTGAAASTGTRREGRAVALRSPATDFRRSTARTLTTKGS